MLPQEFKFAFAKISDKKKLYFGIIAALFAAGIAAVIPYIYGRLVDVAILPNSEIKIILGFISLWLFVVFK